MIVFDENIHQQRLMDAVASWYPGRVVSIKTLRPTTSILDKAIPTLLHQIRGVTFVTTNVADFWRRIPAHRRYGVVCIACSSDRMQDIPGLLRRLFRLALFRTKAARLGKVVRVGPTMIQYYQAGDPRIYTLRWSE